MEKRFHFKDLLFAPDLSLVLVMSLSIETASAVFASPTKSFWRARLRAYFIRAVNLKLISLIQNKREKQNYV